MGKVITQQSLAPAGGAKIAPGLYLAKDKVELTAYTISAGGFAYTPSGMLHPLYTWFEHASGYELSYNEATGKIQLWNPSGSHTHAVALDTGVSAEPSAVANFPAQGFESFYLATITAGATKYLGVNATEGAAVANVIQWVIPADGFLRGVRGNLNTAPGAGKSYAVTLQKNGSDAALTFTIADTATNAEDFAVGHAVPVSKGDLICFKCIETAAGAAAGFSASVIYEITAGAIGIPAAAHTHAPGTLADAASGTGDGSTPSEVTGSTTLTFYVLTLGTL